MVEPSSRPGLPGTHRTTHRRAATVVIAAVNVAAILCVLAGTFLETAALSVAAVVALVTLAGTAVAVWRRAVRASWLIVPVLLLGVACALWWLVAFAISGGSRAW